MKQYIDPFWNFALNESTGLSAEAQAIIERLDLYNLGLADRGVTVIKAKLRWENIGLKNPLYGNPEPFVIWQRYENYPADLAQSKAEEDSWVDFPQSIPGFMEAYGREGDTEIVDEWLLDEAYQHDAEVLWIATDNVWRLVATGEFLPPLNKR
jgi:hypothetical protein